MIKFSRALLLVALFHLLLVNAANAQKLQKFRIKLSEKAVAKLEGKALKKDSKGNVLTEISALDALNVKSGANEMKRVFPYAGKFEARHRKHGLHLWYEVSLAKSNANLSGLIKQYAELTEVLVAEEVREKSLIMPIKSGQSSSQPSSLVNDPYFTTQWHYNNTGQSGGTLGADISLLQAWSTESGDDDVIVAIIDGGVDPYHEDLEENMWVNQAELSGSLGVDDDGNGYVDDVNGYNFAYGTGTIEPHYHGVHVAGTVAAESFNNIGVSGVAGGSGAGDGARLMSCQVFADSNVGGFDVAFVYAADNGAVISQNSWGYTSPGYYEQSVLDAIDYFIENAGYDENGNPVGPMQGGIVIFAAGNSSSSSAYYPAYYDKVMAVAATDHNDQVAYFSNYGSWVDISAPGDEVYSTYVNNSYSYLSGTSMACPHVSGVAALIVSHFPGITPTGLKQRLTQFADNIDSQNPAYVGLMGAGRLNAYLSLQEEDSIPPAAIDDLSFTDLSFDEVTLTWTATGASDNTGTASGYVIKYSNALITDANFDAATTYVSSYSPQSAGQAEELEVSGLSPSTTYYFAIKAFDFSNNESEISNVISFTTTEPPVLEVLTDSLVHHMYSGKQDTLFIEVSNAGEGILEVAASIQASAAAQTFTLNANLNGKSVLVTDPDSKRKREVQVKPFTYTGPSLEGITIGIPYNSSSLYDAIASEFVERGAQIEIIYSFDSISGNVDILFLDDFALTEIYNANATDLIRDYVASGKSIFIIGDDSYSEPITNAILAGTGITATSFSYLEDYITDIFDHPTTTNVSTIYSGAYGTYFTSSDQSLVLMNDPYGRAHAVATGFGSGKIIAFGNEIAYDPYMEDNELFLHQAIDWLSQVAQWISVSEQEISVAAGATESVPVYFNTNGVNAGEYFADVIVTSNDPVGSEVSVPVHLTVTGSPSIQVSPDSIYFGATYVGTSTGTAFFISNNGTDDLLVNFELPADSAFSLSAGGMVIEADEQDSVFISFNPYADSLYSALITIYSNDPVDSVLYLQITGQGITPPTISVVPDSLVHQMFTGKQDTLTVAVTNTGGGTLQVTPSVSVVNTSVTSYAFNTAPASKYVEVKDPDTKITRKVQVKPFTYNGPSLAGVTIAMTYYYDFAIQLTQRGAQIVDVGVDPAAWDSVDIIVLDDNHFSYFGATEIAALRNHISKGNSVFIVGDDTDYTINQILEGTGITGVSTGYNNYYITDIFDHPTTKDVSTIVSYSAGVYYSVTDPSVVLMNDDYGRPHAVATSFGNGRILAFGNEIIGDIYSGDNNLFLHQTIDWLLDVGSWISTSNDNIGIPAGTTAYIPVYLNTSDINGGEYFADLVLDSNDPLNGQVSVPVHLSVTGSPAISLAVDSVNFGQHFIGSTSTNEFVISNPGTDDLHLTFEIASDSVFTLSNQSMTIGPDEEAVLSISFTPQADSIYDRTLTIYSNDPIDSVLYVSMTGQGVHPPVMTVTPDSISTTLDAGYFTVETLTIGNVTGSSDLTWTATVSYYPEWNANVAPQATRPLVNKEAGAALKKFIEARPQLQTDTLGNDDWINLDPEYGTVVPGTSQTVDVGLDAQGLTHGVYEGVINIFSNDPQNSFKQVPVTLNVIGHAEIWVSSTSLSFGTTFLGSSKTDYVFVQNQGSKDLELSVENSDSLNYFLYLTDDVLEPGEWCVVIVTFMPSSVGQFNAEIVIHSNDESDPVVAVSLSGDGVNAPVAVMEPSELFVAVPAGHSSTAQFMITNEGESDLEVMIPSFNDSSFSVSSAGNAFGYTWKDNSEIGGPVFDWIDISGIGTRVYLSDDDYEPVALPFNFTYFGVSKTNAFISSNGYLAFTESGASSTGPSLLNGPSGYPNDLIAALGRDLLAYAPSKVLYHGNSSRFVVTYENVTNFSGYGVHTFQIILYPSGKIKLQYLNTDGTNAAQIGIEDIDGLKGFVIANYSDLYLTDLMAIEITGGSSFITDVSPTVVAIQPGTSQTFDITVDASEFESGTHTEVVNILTNDPVKQVIPYTVTMEVITVPQFTSALSDTVYINEGDSLTFLFAATNPRNAVLTFSLLDSVQNASITEDGVFRFNADFQQAGLHTFTVTVDDGILSNQQSFWINVANVNRAPYVFNPINSMKGKVGETTVISGYSIFADEDFDNLEFQVSSDEPHLVSIQVIDSSGYIEIAFLGEGLVPVTITATDSEGAQASELFVVDSKENQAPVLVATLPDMEVSLKEPSFEITLSDYFSDPDGDTLEYSYAVDENYGDVNIEGQTLSFMATTRGEMTVAVTAIDPTGGGDITSSFVVNIRNRKVKVKGEIPDHSADLSEPDLAIKLKHYFEDEEGDSITYTVTSSVAGFVEYSIDGEDLNIHANLVGTTTITVIADDGFGELEEDAFELTMFNRAPVSTNEVPDALILLNGSNVIDLTGYFGEPDGEALSYDAESSVAGLVSFDINGGSLSINGLALGETVVTVAAIDPHGAEVSQSFKVSVNENNAPQLIKEFSNILAELAAEKISLSLAAHIADEDTLSYSVEVENADVLQTEVVGDSLHITLLDKGKTDITIVATDPFGASVTASFEVKVVNHITGAGDDETLESISVHPNPAVDNITITYSVERKGNVSLHLLDNQGRVVEEILTAEQLPGKKELEYKPTRKLLGLYFIRCQSEQRIEVQKVVFK